MQESAFNDFRRGFGPPVGNTITIRRPSPRAGQRIESLYFVTPGANRPDKPRESLQLETLRAVLDNNGQPIVVIDDAAAVLFANRAARSFALASDALRIDGGRLQLTQWRNSQALAAALEGRNVRWIHIHDATGRSVATARIQPIAITSADGSTTTTNYLVQLRAQLGQPMINIQAATALFGLTPAEACVAAQLPFAARIRDLADTLELSVNTIKAHLKHIFQKCEVSSSAQLVALLLSVSAH
ncbi:MAG: helix-turn-helix transcriptional regulator [Steroidobacteraceae bacterium]